ncbi:hypothetical protein [Streptomyces canus]|uniref:hypothetical protein n=1 Tax=Streptomyces canus TaxID=58343 RepID=UPI0036E9E001
MNVRLEVLVGDEWRPVRRMYQGAAQHLISDPFLPVPEESQQDLWQQAVSTLGKFSGHPVSVMTECKEGTETVLFGAGAAGPFRVEQIQDEA